MGPVKLDSINHLGSGPLYKSDRRARVWLRGNQMTGLQWDFRTVNNPHKIFMTHVYEIEQMFFFYILYESYTVSVNTSFY